MKTKPFAVFSLAAAGLLLAGCSTINSRINEKGSVFYSLDAESRAKIEHGDIAIGFTPDMVYMALGKPDTKRFRTTADGTAETWVYGAYYYDGPHVGYHRWGAWGPRGFYRMYWEPVHGSAYRTEPDIRVTFQNGKVVSIEQSQA